MSEGTIVTFYSYKGGVGRTFALANIAALLSMWGYKVLCIDWDLEAPGLHIYFKSALQQQNRQGLIEMVQAHADEKTPDWRDFVTRVNFSGAKEPLLFMKAGLQDKSYIQRMQALDWNELYNKHDLGNFLEDLRNDWKKNFDFVLIDSRTGVTDIGSICTIQLPDILLTLLTANDQSLEGSLNVLERIQATRVSFAFDRAKLLIVPIISRLAFREEYELANEWLAKFAKALAPIYEDWRHKDITVADLLNHLRLPNIPFWSFGEKLPVIEKGTNDREDIGFPLETLAALVAQQFSFSEILVRNRDSYVDAARKKPAINSTARQTSQQARQQKTPARLFLSYADPDEPYCRELEKHLAPLRRRNIIETWSAGQIPAGASRISEVDLRLQEANVILLLISSDYLASPYSDPEMYQAIARHNAGEAITIPIILRPTDWMGSPIGQLQVLPRDGVPVTQWNSRDAAWADVVSGIRQVIEDLRKA